MKILHLISSSGMYGAEAVILNLCRSLETGKDRGMVGAFVNSQNPNLQLHQTASREGIPSYLIPCDGPLDRGAIGRVREMVSATGANIVHAHGYKADIYACLALRKTATPIFSTCHTWYDNDWKARLYGVVDRVVLRAYTRIVAVSEDVRRTLIHSGVRSDKVRLIRNGIDLRPFAGVTTTITESLGWKGHQLVGLVGRLAPEKGIDIFIQAAAKILNEIPEARFVVIGDGPDRASLEARIANLGIGEKMRMLGRRDDMPSVYASLDVMVSTSRQEGLPIAILEGMASRLPVVATAVGEVPSLIEGGRTGRLVASEDVHAIASSTIELLRDAAMRERFGAAARQRVEDQYSAERMSAEYLQMYAEAIGSTAQEFAASSGHLSSTGER